MTQHLREADTPVPAVTSAADDPTSAKLDQLHAQLARFDRNPYLLTVTADHRPHCGTVTAQWDASGTRLTAEAPSSWPGSAAVGYSHVSLVWPPAQPEGYSLVIDGDAVAEGANGLLAICLTRAVLYRRGPGRSGSDTSCASDCIPILGP